MGIRGTVDHALVRAERMEQYHEGVEGGELEEGVGRECREVVKDDGGEAVGLGREAVRRVLEDGREGLEADQLRVEFVCMRAGRGLNKMAYLIRFSTLVH